MTVRGDHACAGCARTEQARAWLTGEGIAALSKDLSMPRRQHSDRRRALRIYLTTRGAGLANRSNATSCRAGPPGSERSHRASDHPGRAAGPGVDHSPVRRLLQRRGWSRGVVQTVVLCRPAGVRRSVDLGGALDGIRPPPDGRRGRHLGGRPLHPDLPGKDATWEVGRHRILNPVGLTVRITRTSRSATSVTLPR